MAVIALNRGGVIYGDPIRPLINRRINTGSIIEWGHIWPNKCKFVKKNGKSKALDEEPLFAKESGGAFAFNPGRRWECERELSQEIKCDYERKSKERENYEENRVWGKFMRSESEREVYERQQSQKRSIFILRVKSSERSFLQILRLSVCSFLYSITMQPNCKGRLQWTFVLTGEKAKATMADVRILFINSKQHKLPLIGCLTRFVFCSNKSSIFLS